MIQSSLHGLHLESSPSILVDEDLSTIRKITSDSGGYDDLGDQSFVCESCGAMMWYGERLDKHKNASKPKILLCFMDGKVQLPNFKEPPALLSNLLFGRDRRSRHFQDNIRSYNTMFSFTSVNVETSINNGAGPYTFLLHGQNYHLLESLLPEEGARPKFDQLINAVRSRNNSHDLDPTTVSSLKDMIDNSNILARSYRAARDRICINREQGVKLKLVKSQSTDGLQTQSKKLQRISELHPLYLALQYPLIFPYGEDRYREEIPLRETSRSNSRKRKYKLFQQLNVDAFSMVESQRLIFIRLNQAQLRVDMYKSIEERVGSGDNDGKSVGTRIIIPITYTNGPRYMFNNFMDALQICNWIGFPSLYITITCNPKWPEIRGLKYTNLRPEDRPDVLCRIFKMKLDNIDRIISAGIPDKTSDRKMYKLVKKYMIHGPCGQANMKSPCTNNGVCSKQFPKRFVQRTEAGEDGYHSYKRMDNGRIVTKKNIVPDNGFVVLYYRDLLLKYRAHINIELCNQNKSIKYMFKVTIAFHKSQNTHGGPDIHDEIKMYNVL
ncbi:hypothetical protein ABFS83_13G041800 [Erythranthe nasuta]